MLRSSSVLMVCFAVVFAAACAVVDVRTRRIPNRLTGPAILVGIALNALLYGGTGAVRSLEGAILAVGVLLVPFALGGIGGGDVKMMSAVGALLGPEPTAVIIVVGMIFGGLMMLAHLARIGRLGSTLTRMRQMLVAAALTRSVAPLKVTQEQPGAVALPYGVPMGLATVVVVTIGLLARG